MVVLTKCSKLFNATNFSIGLTFLFFLLGVCQRSNGQSFKEFPIIGYCGEDYLVSDSDFHQLKEAGFNACLCYYPNIPTAQRALKNAQQHDIGIILYVPEVRKNISLLLDSLGNHPNILAYFLYDEPRKSQQKWLEGIVNQFNTGARKRGLTTNVYVNLFPCYSNSMISDILEAESYIDYLDCFSSVMGNQYSFDYYPIVEKGVRKSWYDNLKQVRDVSRLHGKPFWAYILSTPHNVYPQPTLGALKLQVFVSLIYGAKGIQYFTYTTPKPQGVNDYHNGPIERNGQQTLTYLLTQQTNERIRQIYPFFSEGSLGEVVRIPYGHIDTSNHILINASVDSSFGVLATQLNFRGNEMFVFVNLDYESNAVFSFPSLSYEYFTGGVWTAVSGEIHLPPGDVLLIRAK